MSIYRRYWVNMEVEGIFICNANNKGSIFYSDLIINFLLWNRFCDISVACHSTQHSWDLQFHICVSICNDVIISIIHYIFIFKCYIIYLHKYLKKKQTP